MTERLVLIAATLVLAAIGLLPVAAMLRETLIANGHFSLDAYRALLASDGHFALLMGHSLEGELVQVSGRSGDKVKLTVRTPSGEQQIDGSDILVAVGRITNTAGIGLKETSLPPGVYA